MQSHLKDGAMPNFLKPHSPEWFEALEKINPAQAAQTKQLISLAGRNDVCSVCGDEESFDYKLASEQITSGVVSTLRLCEDCLKIRKNMYGENFLPFIN
jgi:hypothetical protein